jgi:lysozyme family protein
MLGDLWPKGPDQIVFDIAVNSGTGRAPQIMRAAMGNPSGGIATGVMKAAVIAMALGFGGTLATLVWLGFRFRCRSK